MDFVKTTEQDSNHNNLERKNITQLLEGIHKEDKNALEAVGEVLDKIKALIEAVVKQQKIGGRLFYIGAGTSGRIGVLDASECPPTFGTDPDQVIGIIAGGDHALRNSIENAEDDPHQAWEDLKVFNINSKDFVLGIAASGTTPYVVAGLHDCQSNKITTGSISCNRKSPLSAFSDFPVEVIVGPEFVTGSSRMKAGTAQKLILNMITTSTMIQLGHVKGNKMVDMKLSNKKLIGRAESIVMEELNTSQQKAKKLLELHGNVRNAINAVKNHE
ncbi:MAG: N-acetylmuramic acid 6-phosphate etherase [Flavobacteriales bacterium]|jgi:N-acetylmuramic acid 6-phosphate etherase|tara:strand:+ start:290 stop:1108 length:819 start_codon:yes stop_codon:yes gene_type:complete